jgi:hypothetical protein
MIENNAVSNRCGRGCGDTEKAMRNAARAGRETVCKGAGHHDDLANSAAGSLCLAALLPRL